ncbi:protein-disulfide reductase DsbD family protein [Gilvimarinus algae]|uniref:Protein-disulfide reductase DsbD n=1 Tax=Gilvimarinus algae TaxID=3058037 RepID=A0ABT8TFR2_9GAMM|nr:protein-disulfide reductase DsbD [Gilvimarinus sp. SDUM040014]MDO3382893.1 protein-disulfide reductase DsbD [Gilvimarinus sp. SDUM040014]
MTRYCFRCLLTLGLLTTLFTAGLDALAEENAGLQLLPPASGPASPAAKPALGSSTGAEPEFLPVTEAYLVSSWLKDGTLTVHWDIEPGYYLYQEQFKLTRTDGSILTPNFSESIEKYDEYFEKHMAVHYTSATLTVALAEKSAPFALKVQSQGCADAGLCYPPHDDYFYIDPAAGTTEIIDAEDFTSQPRLTKPAPTASAVKLATALLFALIGGVILNLMPCVFPVLSIKVMSLASADRSRLARHGWAYTAGIVLCFIAFASILLIARAGGEAIGWGFQLQSPLLVAALVYLFVLMGLALSGVINLSAGWMGVGQGLTQRDGLSGSFFTGVLAAVVASPCTAPFMGVALGFALTQPAGVSLSVFAALGLGMALPLLLLCYFPRLIHYLPKPGPWMDSLKQALAFPLYLTAIWLLWVLGRQAGSDSVIALLLGALAFAFALWLTSHKPAGRVAKALVSIAAGACVVLALALPYTSLEQRDSELSRWEAYSASRLAELRADGRGVLVNLTANWCLTCLANERVTLHTDAVEQAFDRYQVATLKGDWTNRDPAITQLLDEYNRSGVPLYLWFAPGKEGPAEILPQLLRKEHLLRAFEQSYKP